MNELRTHLSEYWTDNCQVSDAWPVEGHAERFQEGLLGAQNGKGIQRKYKLKLQKAKVLHCERAEGWWTN